jgi:hypothetical protein
MPVAGILNDYRDLIIRTFGENGRKGLAVWSKIETITQVYGAVRGITALVKLAARMKSALGEWRALRASLKGRPTEDLQAPGGTIAAADKALQEIENTAKEPNIDHSRPAADDNAEEALALASGDRPRVSADGGTGGGGRLAPAPPV